MIIYPVRCCYVSVFSPAKKPNSEDKQYTLVAMVPKNNKQLVDTIHKAQDQAIKAAIEKGKFTKAQAAAPTFKRIIRDGDKEFAAETRGPEFQGHYFFSCNRGEDKGAPQIVKREPGGQLVPILNPDEFYSGVWAALDINFYGFKAGGSRGVAVGLNNAMKYKDDSRLDGRLSADQAFGDIEGELGEVDGGDDMVPDGAFE